MIPEEKLRSKTSKICVVGLGYVGLPLAIHIAQKGFRVTGLDSDAEKLTMLRAGMSYIEDVPNHLVSSLIDTGELQVTDSYGITSEMDVLIICVPSPIDHQKSPDLSYVTSCCKSLLPNLRESQLIILESTVYPGATEEIILPLLSEGTLVPEEHFWIAYSPERIDPGNKQYTIENVPKLVSGISKMGSHLAKTFYDQLLKAEVIEVSSPKVAETAKLLENVFRSINIAFAHEMDEFCRRMGMNTWEVIEAAKTKPYGFMPFYPGPGVGGHCIPLHPYFLTHKARETGARTDLIDLSTRINESVPQRVVDRIIEGLKAKRKNIQESEVLILGVAYKKDMSDTRHSPALDIITLLEKAGATVMYHDPHVPSLHIDGRTRKSTELSTKLLGSSDCVVIVTDHSDWDYQEINNESRLVIDTRNSLEQRGL